jgi:hypothetical protein
MTDFAEEYQALSRRREGIVSQIAVRRADEERKTKERDEIEAELRTAGIDPTKPDEEIARLTKELQDNCNKISKEFDLIEKLLAPEVSPPEPEIAIRTVETVKPTPEEAVFENDGFATEEELEAIPSTTPLSADAEDILID